MSGARVVLTILPDELHRRAAMIAARNTIFERVKPSTLRAALELHGDAVVLLDPIQLSDDTLIQVFDALHERTARVVLYGRPTKGTTAVILRVSAYLPHAEFVLAYEYEEPEWLKEQLRLVRPDAVLPRLLSVLRTPLVALEEPVRTCAVGVFGRQHGCTAREFLARVEVPERTVRRWFRKAGFDGLARFARGVRLAGALDRCCFGDEAIETTAQFIGVAGATTLNGLTLAAVGLRIERVGIELTPLDVATRIARYVCR